MLLRLAYLSVTSAFALLRLLAVSDGDKEVEIVVLRHASTTWADFLRSRAGALLACDFFETVTLTGALCCAQTCARPGLLLYARRSC